MRDEIIADLHIHTHQSDGSLNLEDIIRMALDKGLKYISITDHDIVFNPSSHGHKNQSMINIIPGCEISSDYEGHSVHILAYGIKDLNSFTGVVSDNVNTRNTRNQKILSKLQNMGYKIEFEDIASESTNEIIGRPHFAKALIKNGYFRSIEEVFDHLLGNGKPGYVKRESWDVREATEIIRSFGGKSFIAHPGLFKDISVTKKLLTLKIFDGIECYHSKHSEKLTKEMLNYSLNNGMTISGGSDFHSITQGVYPGSHGLGVDLFEKFYDSILK